ncbi:MAG: sigma-70 family RNA polymerase sigma factor [Phycisphaeraceae bacterium]|nr:sigma-70 family RNA polymerase sigma factor [Phycisphaeraceae bacterium]
MALPDDTRIDAMKEIARLWVSAQPMVLAYIRSCIDSYADAEDVLQTVAQDVVVKYAQYDKARPFVGWTLWLAKSRIIDHYRKSGRDRHRFGDEVLDRLSNAFERIEPEAHPQQEALSQCIKKLPEKSMQLLELRYTDGLRPQEMAQSLGTSSGTVRVALTRMRKALARCIEQWLRREGKNA